MPAGPSPLDFRLQRLRLQVAELLRIAASENRVRVPLAMFAVIFAFWVLLERVALGGFPVAVVRSLLSIAEIVLGVYISIELLVTGLQPSSRDRIDPPSAVVEFYEERGCANEFVRMTELPGWRAEEEAIDRVPGVVESVPERPVATRALSATVHEEFYPLPDRVERLYEPVADDLREKFVDEGNFNQIKTRPVEYDETAFELGTTTFFNNYVTNLSPDYDLYEHRTPRELLHPLVFSPDGTLRSLTETDLPYIAASAGMVIAENGETVLPIRSRDVVIEGMALGLSFGGSWDADLVETEGVHAQIVAELDEERGIPPSMDVDVRYLGTMRRLELMGKPDCFVTAVVDGVPDWTTVSREETETVVVRLVPEGVTVEGIETLVEHVETVNERVLGLLTDSAYAPSPGLLYWLYLLNCHADASSDSE